MDQCMGWGEVFETVTIFVTWFLNSPLPLPHPESNIFLECASVLLLLPRLRFWNILYFFVMNVYWCQMPWIYTVCVLSHFSHQWILANTFNIGGWCIRNIDNKDMKSWASPEVSWKVARKKIQRLKNRWWLFTDAGWDIESIFSI